VCVCVCVWRKDNTATEIMGIKRSGKQNHLTAPGH